MTATSYAEYVSSLTERADAGEVKILGSLIFTHVPDSVRVTPQALEEGLKRVGLPLELMPAKIDPKNAFKKATGKDRFKLTYKLGEDTVEIQAEPVKTAPSVIARKFVRKQTSTRLQYNADVGEALFYTNRPGHPQGPMTTKIAPGLSPEETAELARAVVRLRADYECYSTHYDGHAIRYVIRDALRGAQGVLAGAGRNGAWFVSRNFDVELHAMRELFSQLSCKVEFQLVPVLDMPDQREWLTKTAVSETELDVERLLEDIHDGVTAPKLARMMGELRALEDRGAQYADLLGISEQRLALALTRARKALTKAAERVSE